VAAAACFICVFLAGFNGQRLYFTQTSLISVDINPSIEIALNRFDRVIHIKGFNDEGTDIINSVKLMHKKYADAIDILLQSEKLIPYISTDKAHILFAVHSDTHGKDAVISDVITGKYGSLSKHNRELQSECVLVSRETVNDAHAHNVTPGKYLALLKQKEAPLEIESETHNESGHQNSEKIQDITEQTDIHFEKHAEEQFDVRFRKLVEKQINALFKKQVEEQTDVPLETYVEEQIEVPYEKQVEVQFDVPIENPDRGKNKDSPTAGYQRSIPESGSGETEPNNARQANPGNQGSSSGQSGSGNRGNSGTQKGSGSGGNSGSGNSSSGGSGSGGSGSGSSSSGNSGSQSGHTSHGSSGSHGKSGH
jgi:hypothetical protein